MTTWSGLHYFCFIIYISLAAFLTIRNPKSTLNTLSAVLIAIFGFWSFSMAFLHSPYVSLQQARLIERLNAPFWICFPSLGIWFALVFAAWNRVLEKPLFYIANFSIPAVLLAAVLSNRWTIINLPRPYGWAQQFPNDFWSYL